MGGGSTHGDGAGADAGTWGTGVWVWVGGTTAPVAASIRCRRWFWVKVRTMVGCAKAKENVRLEWHDQQFYGGEELERGHILAGGVQLGGHAPVLGVL